MIIEVDGPDVAFDAGEENSEREANEEEEYDDLPQPAYKYKFPFDDGRRMGVPAGSLMDNYRAIYQEISGEILVRTVPYCTILSAICDWSPLSWVHFMRKI